MKKTIIALCILLNGCGAGDRTVVENTSVVNCNSNVTTMIIPKDSYLEEMTQLEDLGAEVLKQEELPTGDIIITYSFDCSDNGNVDMSKPTTTVNTETNEQ